jgi:hypothetical protein
MSEPSIEQDSGTVEFDEAPKDLADVELQLVNSRIGGVLAKYGALPFHSLLYRVGEVAAQRLVLPRSKC